MDISILDCNPYKDGIRNDANAFNDAILKCHQSGGGKVIVEDGVYMSGSIKLLSNVTLYLNENAKIILSDNLDDFYNISIDRDSSINVPTWENCEYNGKPSKYFIYALNEENIGIDGKGIIDGNDKIFYGTITKWHIEGAYYPRIPLIYFEGCKNYSLKNVTLCNSGFWTVHLVGDENGIIEGLTINNNLKMTNSDGIDPDHCKNLLIKNCNISAADDCIVLKTTSCAKEYKECSNIHVYNCNLRSTSAAIKIGTESVSDFKDISFNDINIVKSNRGISLQLRDEGSISNIEFNNINIETKRMSPIHWWGKAEAIAITAVPRKKEGTIGNISNISFNNVKTNGENGILIYGIGNINNISFNNVDVDIVRKTNWKKELIDLRPSEGYNIIKGGINAIYSRGANGINMNNCSFKISDTMKKYVIGKEIDIEV